MTACESKAPNPEEACVLELAWPRKPRFLALRRALAGAVSQIPTRVPLAVLIWGLMGIWGRERNAHSGMNCGFRGQGQTEQRSAFLEPMRDPIQEGRCCMSQLSSGQKFEAIDVDVHLLFGIREKKQRLLQLHLPLLVDRPYYEGSCLPSLFCSLSSWVLGRPVMTHGHSRGAPLGAKCMPELEEGRFVKAHLETLVGHFSVLISGQQEG